MGVLLSICFKSRDETGSSNPQIQIKKQRSVQIQREKSLNKHLLESSGRSQSYNSTQSGSPSSPKLPGFISDRERSERHDKERHGWTKSHSLSASPAYMEHNSAPGAFMTPPPSPREREEMKQPRSFSFKLSAQDSKDNKGPRKSFRKNKK